MDSQPRKNLLSIPMNIDLAHLRSQRIAILKFAVKYGIRRVRLFGSVARGQSNPTSDVDVLVDFEPGRSLLDQVGFEQELEELLGHRIDVVAEWGVRQYTESQILQEPVAL